MRKRIHLGWPNKIWSTPVKTTTEPHNSLHQSYCEHCNVSAEVWDRHESYLSFSITFSLVASLALLCKEDTCVLLPIDTESMFRSHAFDQSTGGAAFRDWSGRRQSRTQSAATRSKSLKRKRCRDPMHRRTRMCLPYRWRTRTCVRACMPVCGGGHDKTALLFLLVQTQGYKNAFMDREIQEGT